MARVATPANQVNTCSTGSRPSIAKITMQAAAVMVWVSEDRCGETCFGWTVPRRAGRTPAFDIECW